jgi:hypothetical protein
MPKTVYAVSEGQKFAGDSDLVVVTCSSCGITYAIPESFRRSMLKYRGDKPNGWTTICPLGHEWWYVGQTEQEKLRRQLDRQRDATAYERSRRDQAEASARAQKAAKTRIKNDRDRIKRRVASGVCPCCNRSFKNLKRHMSSQHPGFAEDE